jgi:pimeloyl-ACP methyl ester carboxylesterase
VTGADGQRRAIVDVPGTKSWDPGRTDDVTSLSTNARALDGASTTYERGVLDAMTRAGVTNTDQVMIVGHSEGGMVAVTAARDAVRSGRFDVTHVVTAGAPIARSVGDLPESVRVLALENDHDVVPAIDGAANPASPNVTTVHFDVDTATVGGNHGLSTAYEAGAAETDASGDPSVHAFTDSAEGFLDGTDEDTQLYLITRKY